MHALRLSFVLTSACLLTASVSATEPVCFPWGQAPAAQHSNPAYQTLAAPQPRRKQPLEPIQPLQPKPSYAYGWFGSNPSLHWNRHFGYSQGFTQWSRQ